MFSKATQAKIEAAEKAREVRDEAIACRDQCAADLKAAQEAHNASCVAVAKANKDHTTVKNLALVATEAELNNKPVPEECPPPCDIADEETL